MEDGIRVVIADGNTLLREGLVHLLQKEESLEVAGEASNGWETLLVAEEAKPDILLLDLGMPEIEGFEIFRQIRKRSSSTKILALIDCFDQEVIFRALQRGARGYLLKNVPCTELIKAIRAIHSGEAWVERRMVGRLLEELPRFMQETDCGGNGDRLSQLLSPRETEVALLVARGFSNKEIAHNLSISEKTVKSHLVSIFKKFQVRHRFQLAIHMLQYESALHNHTEANTLFVSPR